MRTLAMTCLAALVGLTAAAAQEVATSPVPGARIGAERTVPVPNAVEGGASASAIPNADEPPFMSRGFEADL